MRVDITWRSIFRVLGGVLLAYLAVVLWPIFKVLLLSILLAVALYPLVSWACRKGWPIGDAGFLASLSQRTSQPLQPRRPGRPRRTAG